MFEVQLTRDECDIIRKALQEYISLCHRRTARTGHTITETKLASRAASRVSSAMALFLNGSNVNDQ